MESRTPIWRRIWRPFETKWILLPSIVLMIYGPSCLLRAFGLKDTPTPFLWYWCLPAVVALALLGVGVVKYRRQSRGS